MNAEWKTFLESRGATFDETGIAHFPGAESGSCALFDLSHLGLIRVSGEEREPFLQGQLTNDTRELAKGRSQLSGYCSPKGRMLSSMRLVETGESTLMQLPAERVAPTMKRLQMFILMSKVQLSDARDGLTAFGLYGDGADTLLGSGAPAEVDDALTAADDVTIVRLAADAPRYLLIGPVGAMRSRWEQLSDNAFAASEEFWRLLDIRAGLPTIFDATSEAFVPQMANMQLINGVSFTKGCYTGQEVVARMQYLGKLKRRMYRVAVEGECPAPGTALAAAQSTSGQGAGKIVISAPSSDHGCESLAVIEVAAAESGGITIDDGSGRSVELLELPYAFEEND